ncbi:glycosyltransferase [Lachnospiraceae bacterium 29-91]
MENKYISVIVPIYNTKKYINECLDSIVYQSYSNFQIILIDDGSTDGSGEICDEYAKRDKRIKVVHQRNMGLVNARKKGLYEAEGDYIYYVDSDDWIDKNVIEKFMSLVDTTDLDMISVGIKREYGSGKTQIDLESFESGFYNNEEIREKLIPHLISTDKFFEWGQHLTYWHYLIKKKLLQKNLIKVNDQIRMAEDVACVYPCILDSNNIYINCGVYYHYRQRSDSMKWTQRPDEYVNLQKVYHVLKDKFLVQKEKQELMKKAKYLLLFEILTSVPEKMLFKVNTFPYNDFPYNSKIIVYGAGLFGNMVVNALQHNHYADIIAWVDNNYMKYQKEGVQVLSPEKLKILEYDYIILAVIRADIRENIRSSLYRNNISIKKIIDFDLDKINQTPLPKEFETDLE